MNLKIDKMLQFNGWLRFECICCIDISISTDISILGLQSQL